jgi:hypothetical protein
MAGNPPVGSAVPEKNRPRSNLAWDGGRLVCAASFGRTPPPAVHVPPRLQSLWQRLVGFWDGTVLALAYNFTVMR